MTGLRSTEVRAAFDDLAVEGANLPAPERAEVAAFLEAQSFRIRTDPTLTEHRRARASYAACRLRSAT